MGRHVVLGAGPTGTAIASDLAERGEDVVVVTRSGGGPEGVEGVERVPEGTTHCVDVRELSPTLLEVDLTEYPPGADPVLIRQRVRVAENPGGTWGIVSITPAG